MIDVIPSLKYIADKAYRSGNWDSTIDTIEEAIVELERLRETVAAFKDENAHLLAMNQRLIEEIAGCRTSRRRAPSIYASKWEGK